MTTAGTYEKKPVRVRAIQFTGDNPAEVRSFHGVEFTLTHFEHIGPALLIQTTEGDMAAIPGDWIIRGTRGELYPCKPRPFTDTYTLTEEQPA